MADGVSPRVKVLFGLVPLLMGLLILGALAGFVPIGEGAFFAPTWVTAAIGAGLILFAFLVWIPGSAPATLRSSLGVVALLLMAVVCNWTAFGPSVRYTSEVNLGLVMRTGEDPVGGRIAFGQVAVVIDLLLAYSLFEAIQRRLRRG